MSLSAKVLGKVLSFRNANCKHCEHPSCIKNEAECSYFVAEFSVNKKMKIIDTNVYCKIMVD